MTDDRAADASIEAGIADETAAYDKAIKDDAKETAERSGVDQPTLSLDENGEEQGGAGQPAGDAKI